MEKICKNCKWWIKGGCKRETCEKYKKCNYWEAKDEEENTKFEGLDDKVEISGCKSGERIYQDGKRLRVMSKKEEEKEELLEELENVKYNWIETGNKVRVIGFLYKAVKYLLKNK